MGCHVKDIRIAGKSSIASGEINMWFVVMLFMAVLSTLIWYLWDRGDEYRVDILVLVCWETTIMVFRDHLMGYVEEGVFLNTSLNAFILGIVMAIVALLIWVIALIIKDSKGKI